MAGAALTGSVRGPWLTRHQRSARQRASPALSEARGRDRAGGKERLPGQRRGPDKEETAPRSGLYRGEKHETRRGHCGGRGSATPLDPR